MTVHVTKNIGQYRLGLQIGSLDRNRLCTIEETRHQNRELSAEQRGTLKFNIPAPASVSAPNTLPFAVGNGIISNTLRHTQYTTFTCRILSLANGTVYVLSCHEVIR